MAGNNLCDPWKTTCLCSFKNVGENIRKDFFVAEILVWCCHTTAPPGIFWETKTHEKDSLYACVRRWMVLWIHSESWAVVLVSSSCYNKIHRLSGLYNTLEAGKSRLRCQHICLRLSSWFIASDFLLNPHMWEIAQVCSCPYWCTNPINGAPPSSSYPNLIIS